MVSAEALHKAGLQLSIATVPNAPGYPGQGGVCQMDLYRLARRIRHCRDCEICRPTLPDDLRSAHAVDHAGPGCRLALDGGESRLCAETVPKEKFSLGIPLYGYHWYTGAPMKDTERPAKRSPTQPPIILAHPMPCSLLRPTTGKSNGTRRIIAPIFISTRDQMREWIFFTDLHTFKDRYELVQQKKIQGFCSWVLGEEDPAIWTFLPQRH